MAAGPTQGLAVGDRPQRVQRDRAADVDRQGPGGGRESAAVISALRSLALVAVALPPENVVEFVTISTAEGSRAEPDAVLKLAAPVLMFDARVLIELSGPATARLLNGAVCWFCRWLNRHPRDDASVDR